jgi:hypothetical protein
MFVFACADWRGNDRCHRREDRRGCTRKRKRCGDWIWPPGVCNDPVANSRETDMSTGDLHILSEASRRRSRLYWLVVLQISLFVLSAVAFSYIGWRVKPLLQQEQALRQQIDAEQKVLQQLNSAIAASKDELLVRKTDQIQIQVLQGYKLGIYYLTDNDGGAVRAKDLMTALVAAHFPGEISLYGKQLKFFDYFGHPMGDEIRYELAYESTQAQALVTLLHKVDPTHSYVLTAVENRTPNFISIFIPDGVN